MSFRFAAVLLLCLPGAAPALPQAAPSAAPSSGPAPLAVRFTPNDPSGGLYQWQFNFLAGAAFAPDFTSDVPEDVSFTYQAPGSYVARLRIYDAITGVPADHDLPITVLPPPAPPVVALSHDPAPPGPNQVVTFTAGAVASPGRTIVNYFWDLDGDGTTDAQSPGGAAAVVTRSYDALAYRLVGVTAVDDLGLAGTATTPVWVSNPIRATMAAPDPVLAEPGQGISFSARGESTIKPDPWAQVSHTWDYGDGSTPEVLAPDVNGETASMHAYAAVGSYVATVTVRNEAGRTAVATRAVEIRTAPDLLASDRNTGNSFEVELTAQVLLPPGRTVVSFDWDFGDMTTQSEPGGSAINVVTYNYGVEGPFTATVTVTDDLMNAYVATTLAEPMPVTGASVSNPPPPVTLALSAMVDGAPGATARVGHRFVFTASTDSVLGSTGVYGRVLWDFDGDDLRDRVDDLAGPAVLDTVAAWQYPLPGTYVVKVRSLLIGSAAEDLKTLTVTVTPPTAPLECWIVQPRDGAKVWGDAVTLSAKAAPAGLTARVDFFVRPEFDPGPGTLVGSAAPPPYSALSAPWNTLGFPPGRWEIVARATDTSSGTAFSTDLHTVVVELDPGAPSISESGGNFREEEVDPNGTTRSEISRDTALDLPPYAFGTRTRIRIVRPTGNPHPLEARFQGLNFVPGSFRRLSLVGTCQLEKPSRITLYSLNPGGVVDSLGLDPGKLSIWQFDGVNQRWVPLFSQLTQPGEDLIRATLTSMGDVGIVAEARPRVSLGPSSVLCGALGPELLVLPGLLLWRRRRRAA